MSTQRVLVPSGTEPKARIMAGPDDGRIQGAQRIADAPAMVCACVSLVASGCTSTSSTSRGLRQARGAAYPDDALARQHHVTLEPSVIILDASGRETVRREGESEQTIQALKKDLDAIRGDKP